MMRMIHPPRNNPSISKDEKAHNKAAAAMNNSSSRTVTMNGSGTVESSVAGGASGGGGGPVVEGAVMECDNQAKAAGGEAGTTSAGSSVVAASMEDEQSSSFSFGGMVMKSPGKNGSRAAAHLEKNPNNMSYPSVNNNSSGKNTSMVSSSMATATSMKYQPPSSALNTSKTAMKARSNSVPRRRGGGNSGSAITLNPSISSGAAASLNHHHPGSSSNSSSLVGSSSTNSNNPCSALNCATAKKCVNLCEAYGIVCPWAAVVAARTTKKTIQELFHHSRLFHPENPPVFRQIYAQEVRLGDKLGEGGFSIVSKCALLSRSGDSDHSSKDNNSESSKAKEMSHETTNVKNGKGSKNSNTEIVPVEKSIATNNEGTGKDEGGADHGYWSASSVQSEDDEVEQSTTETPDYYETKQELAIKYLRRRAMVDYHHFKHGAADLAVEAYFLQTLSHPNIINLHGIAAGSIEANILSRNCGVGGCFLILDRLVETLEQRIETWKKSNNNKTAPSSPSSGTITSAADAWKTIAPKSLGKGANSSSKSLGAATSNTTSSNFTTAARTTSTCTTSSSDRSNSTSASNTLTTRQSYLCWSRSFMTNMVRYLSGGTGGKSSYGSGGGGGFVVLATRGGRILLSRKKELRHVKQVQLLERLDIALSVARAMEYLHSMNVMFRDLKPSNIGFNEHGTLKLFDFGLAKEIKGPPGTYRLTGHTGSRRYMAPEVAKGSSDYDLSVDVYGFGIMLWELCCAQKPFYGYSSNKHTQLVVMGGERPKMDPSNTRYWPNELQTLMRNCWSAIPSQRPSFRQIVSILQQMIDTTKLEVNQYVQQQQQRYSRKLHDHSMYNSSISARSGGSSNNSHVDSGDKSLASLSEDPATLAVAAAAATAAGEADVGANASSSLALTWDKANAGLQDPLFNENDRKNGNNTGAKHDETNNNDDISMVRPRRFNFLSRLYSSRGRSRSRRGGLKRSKSWGSWPSVRSNSVDTATSENRRSKQQQGSTGFVKNVNDNVNSEESAEATRLAGASSSAASTSESSVPPALISGASVIQVLTAAGATGAGTKNSLSVRSQRQSNCQPSSIVSSSLPRQHANNGYHNSESSIGKEHETMAIATTSSSGGDDLEVSFHSAAMDEIDVRSGEPNQQCHKPHEISFVEVGRDNSNLVAKIYKMLLSWLSLLSSCIVPQERFDLVPTQYNTWASLVDFHLNNSLILAMGIVAFFQFWIMLYQFGWIDPSASLPAELQFAFSGI